MLTRKQYDLLMFIHTRIQSSGVSPSFDEMKEALDLKSKSGIHRLVTALEERGFVRRLPHRARALEILRLPDNMTQQGRPAAPHLSVIAGDKSEPPIARERERGGFAPAPSRRDSRMVPLIGRIAAGTPIEALQNNLDQIEVPSLMVSASAEHFALEVKGDSMIEAGIHEGDMVVIQRQSSANNGDIIVALVDGEEATLKRLRRKGSTIALEAANPAYETRVFGSDRVQVQGRLVGLIRTY